MQAKQMFKDAQDFVEQVTHMPVAERIESQAAQRRLKQMQAKREKQEKRLAKDTK